MGHGWNGACAAYDRGWVPLLEPLTRSCVNRAGLRRGDRVLDLASGTGAAAFLAAEAVGAGGSVSGVDASENMVLLARERARRRGVPVQFRRARPEVTGSPDASQDAVVCAFGLMLADGPAVCAEIRRVLAPGGRACVCVWGRRARCGWAEAFTIVGRHEGADLSTSFFAAGMPGALYAAFEAAGFSAVVEERVPVSLAWASADEACVAALDGGPLARAFNRFSAQTRAAVRAEYLRSLQPFRRGDRYEVPAEVVFAVARR